MPDKLKDKMILAISLGEMMKRKKKRNKRWSPFKKEKKNNKKISAINFRIKKYKMKMMISLHVMSQNCLNP